MMYAPWHEREQHQKQQRKGWNRLMLVMAGGMIAAGAMLATCDSKPVANAYYVDKAPVLTAEQDEYRKFFAANGSPAALQMAQAVTDPRINPKYRPVLAAVSVAETGADPTVRNAGYKKRHHGAWQVNPAFHGPVSHSPAQQAVQAQAILSDLMVASNVWGSDRWKTALVKYNGGKSTAGRAIAGRYATKVLTLAKGINQ